MFHMTPILTALIAILALAALIVFHELGHFLLARLAGMKVERFSVGFGPILARKQVGETEWAVSALPLGGYVKIAGMDPTEEHADPRAYNNKPPWARLLVIGAGPLANYLLAAILFAIVLMMGPLVPDTSRSDIGDVVPGMPAELAGLERGDRIVEIGGVPIETWLDLQEAVSPRGGEETDLLIERDGALLEITLTPNEVEIQGMVVGQIGIVPHGKRTDGRPPLEALVGGVTYTWDWNARIITALGNIITGREKAELQGPVGIIRETNRAAEEGIVPLLILAAIISVHLALFNLLPIPALDGGRLVFLLLELVRRKPINAKIELTVHAVGFFLLIGLILVVTFKDVGRIFGGS